MPRPPLAPRLVLAALALGGLAACEPVAASPATLTIRYQERPPLTRDRLVVTVADGRNEWYYEGVDLESEEDGWLAGRPLRLPREGSVRVKVAFRGTGQHAVAAGDATIRVAARERWRLDVFTSESAPGAACSGCTGIVRLTIAQESRPSARDWLYLRWIVTDPHPTAP